jgi:hypothetical protein
MVIWTWSSSRRHLALRNLEKCQKELYTTGQKWNLHRDLKHWLESVIVFRKLVTDHTWKIMELFHETWDEVLVPPRERGNGDYMKIFRNFDFKIMDIINGHINVNGKINRMSLAVNKLIADLQNWYSEAIHPRSSIILKLLDKDTVLTEWHYDKILEIIKS